ncbi:hypothetical protein [Hymenobacter sp. BT491]|uniref:hypothetical protein n=1 Tax=Hymenobacter sp. BT491 TaxID=2766779 RepID=UPI001653DB21|nr:hypothetical protein [Hymenobacter sp. BT491]MBC6988883.1 hypothetical protein [Hymenobacter sp. BT491]
MSARLFGSALLLAGLSTGIHAQAQVPGRSLAVKFVPQHLVMSGYWLELESQRREHPLQSFTVTPQFYHGPVGHPDGAANSLNENPSVRGFGVQGQHRFYLRAPTKTSSPAGLYVSYGPHFQHFQVGFERTGWHEVQGPNDLPYYEYGPKHFTETINRYGADVQLGYQAPLLPGPVFFDVYVGAGLRQSNSKSSFGTVQYRSGSSNYGARGLYFPAGVKVGVALR